MNKLLVVILTMGLWQACSNSVEHVDNKKTTPVENPTNKVVLSSEIVWEKLNPARGDQSPQAGTVWGDRKGKVPTGFLAKFVDGFSSPPHIHNVTYRAVVIKGLVHNDDPSAENMWMKPGSFWTQPEGESHITSAKGKENIAYVEIDHGPYLVKPIHEAFDNGERPINIDASNVVWLNNQKTNWIDSKSNAEISFLWEDQENQGMQGLFIKLPQGYNGTIETNGAVLHAIIVQGEMHYKMPQTKETKALDPGSYFTSSNTAFHHVSNSSKHEVIVYVRTNGTVNIDSIK